MKLCKYMIILFIWCILLIPQIQCSDSQTDKQHMQPCIQLEKMYEVTLGTLQALNKALSKRNAECLKAIQTMDEISKKNEKEALYWKDKYIRWQNRVEGLLNVCVVFSVTYAVYEWWRNL